PRGRPSASDGRARPGLLRVYARRRPQQDVVYDRGRMAWDGQDPGGRPSPNRTGAYDRGVSAPSGLALRRYLSLFEVFPPGIRGANQTSLCTESPDSVEEIKRADRFSAIGQLAARL